MRPAEAGGSPWDPRGVPPLVHERTGLVFVVVPGGELEWQPDSEAGEDARTERVTIQPFLLSRTPCTQRA